MFRLFVVLAFLLLPAAAFGQFQDWQNGTAPIAQQAPPLNPAIVRLRAKLNPEFLAWSPEYVMDRCAEHLATINEADRYRIRYFDMSDAPRMLLPAAISSLNFGCNSAHIGTVTIAPRPISTTDNRIFWIDLMWYRWTPEVWENISKEDPYFREPLIPSMSVSLRYLKAYAGNCVVRGSWFIYHTYDTTQFLGKGQIQADQAFYYQLIYGVSQKDVEFEEDVFEDVKVKKTVTVKNAKGQDVQQVKEVVEQKLVKKKFTRKLLVSNAPKNSAEFEKFWKVDLSVLEDFPIDQGAVVDENRSVVSYQNRVIWRIRTALGTYYRTFDVFRSAGDQDFVESPFPTIFDAGEHIVQDAKGAQFYLLTDGNGNRVEFGDPRAVRDHSSGNKVLLTAASCIHCHDNGIIQMRNEMIVLRDVGIELKALGYDRSERARQFFMGNLQRLIQVDQAEYTEFVVQATGLTPQENAMQFARFRSWYAQPVGLVQAARDIGCDPMELSDALATGTKGRLNRLPLDGVPIPRFNWEQGGYQEAFLLLLEYRKNLNAHQ